ncbi:MAG: S8 family serine peptidase [Acidimicrobiia bacterium]|nr:S8 family serine peptidase [Acidimicrobiia bacterium]
MSKVVSRGNGWALIGMVIALVASLLPMTVVGAADPSAPDGLGVERIDPDLIQAIADEGEAEFVVVLDDRPDLSEAFTIGDWEDRGRFVYETLRDHAERSQSDLVSDLEAAGVEHTPFWVANVVLVKGDLEAVETVAGHEEVSSVELADGFSIPEPEFRETDAETQATGWNLDAVFAPQAWDEFDARGDGIVVGVLDGGADFDHPALVDNYRGNTGEGTFDHDYNWFDPSNVCGLPSVEPCDNTGHGTHVTGTVLGDDDAGNQIGVAPEATWISAKGCETSFCSEFALLSSGQWMLAPTELDGNNPDPDLRPHIVNNSWGGNPGDDWFMQMVDNWIAAGMFPQFASGNPGGICSQAGSPGDYPQSYSAGAFDEAGVIYNRSGRGPSQIDGGIKPNLTAPGVEVRSSLPGGGYGLGTGTSMASPHVAGAVAVMWSAAPALVGQIDATRDVLDLSAVDGADTDDRTCGGAAEDNNVWGEGKLDVRTAVEQSPRGEVGILTGTITDVATSEPLAGATVTVTGPLERILTTDETGEYQLPLIVGEYQVSASLYGYEAAEEPATITVDETTTVDFALETAPTTTVTGTVTDGSGQGWPLYARIDIAGYPGGPIFTDPLTGTYQVELAHQVPLTFRVNGRVGEYQQSERAVTLPEDGDAQDFSLTVDPACAAPGYVDDGTGCVPTGGGLIVGEVLDDSGAPLERATVTVDATPDETTTTGTLAEDDPTASPGMFVLHTTSTGATAVTASSHLYADRTDTIAVAAGATTGHVFELASGHLSVDTTPLAAQVEMGGSATVEFGITNDSDVPVNYQLGVRDPAFNIAAGGPGPSPSTEAPITEVRSEDDWKTDASTTGPEATASLAWHRGPDLPSTLARYAHAQCPGDVESFYVLTGLTFDPTFGTTSRMFRFDGRSGTWTELTPAPPVGHENLTAVCAEGRIHLLGGGIYSNSLPAHHYVYDIATDTWSEARPAPRNVWGAEAAYWEGRIYLIGGGTIPAFGPPSDEVNVYDIPTNTWLDNAAPIPTATGVPGVAQVGRYVYVVGGWVTPGTSGLHSPHTYRLDLETGEWTTGPDLNQARGEIAVAATDTALYAIGGGLPGTAPNAGSTVVERLDISGWPNGSWEALDPLPEARGVGRGGFCTELRPGQEIWSVAGGDADITELSYFHQVFDGHCAHFKPPSWVTHDDSIVTLEPDETVKVEVTLDASAEEVDQPGAHQVEVVVRANTPTLPDPVQVTMTVTSPDTWARIGGTIEGLARCDLPGDPLPGATVTVGGEETTSGADGAYARWLEAGTHTVTVAADGYLPFSTEVTVSEGDRATVDAELRPETPCISTTPPELAITVPEGTEVTDHVVVTNPGSVDASFSITEVPFAVGHAPLETTEPGDNPPADSDADLKKGWSTRTEGETTESSTNAEDGWQAGPPLPGGLVRAAHTQCPGDPDSFYVISGVPGDGGLSRNAWRFDASTGTWESLAPIPDGGEGPSAVCTGNTIHVFGGGQAGGTTRHFVYDIATDSWSKGAPAPRQVWGAAVGHWAGRIYLVGGGGPTFSPNFGISDQVNVYDIATDTWIGQAEPLPLASGALGYAQMNQYLYVVGGWSFASPETNVTATHRFDMQTGTWERGPDLALGRGDLAVAATDAALYAIGGNPDESESPFEGTDVVERLDLTAWPEGSWEPFDPLPAPTVALAAGGCTADGDGANIWAVAGANPGPIITEATLRYHRPESCETGEFEIPWLEVAPTNAEVPRDGGEVELEVSVDASDLAVGTHEVAMMMSTTDPGAPTVLVPMSVTVVEETPPTTTPPPTTEPPDTEPPATEPPDTEPPPTTVPGEHPGFGDVPESHLFYDDIIWLATEGITIGCNPPENTMFCPDDAVTRGQMAAFLNRALHLPESSVDHFSDDDTSVFEDDINSLARSGITYGCNPPDNTAFCPNTEVLRQEMASFIVRGYELEPATGGDRFSDDDGSVHEDDIGALAESEVTIGCNPPDNTMFCPMDDVIRGQMAAFLHRADRYLPNP